MIVWGMVVCPETGVSLKLGMYNFAHRLFRLGSAVIGWYDSHLHIGFLWAIYFPIPIPKVVPASPFSISQTETHFKRSSARIPVTFGCTKRVMKVNTGLAVPSSLKKD